MKKIGITTFHLAHNYGAVLQAYALSNYIKKKMNYDVEVLNYYSKKLYGCYRIIRPFRKNIIKYIMQLLNDIKYYRKNKERYNSFDHFINANFKLTKRFNSIKYLDKINEQYDCLITGSDQVWNKKIVGNLSDVYTLNTSISNKKTNRVSYAASIGDIEMVKQNIDEYTRKISKIDYISVREADACQYLNKILPKDKKVVQVVDPTLLMSKQEWNDFLKNNGADSQKTIEKYIVAYDVAPNEEFIKIANYISDQMRLKIIYFDKKNPGFNKNSTSAYSEGPVSFVNYIKNAEYVITTSFHATVFSIIFNKNFFVIPHKQTGSRVISLLNLLDIKGRNYDTYEEFKKIDINNCINWKEVESRLAKERQRSSTWLENSINGGDKHE